MLFHNILVDTSVWIILCITYSYNMEKMEIFKKCSKGHPLTTSSQYRSVVAIIIILSIDGRPYAAAAVAELASGDYSHRYSYILMQTRCFVVFGYGKLHVLFRKPTRKVVVLFLMKTLRAYHNAAVHLYCIIL